MASQTRIAAPTQPVQTDEPDDVVSPFRRAYNTLHSYYLLLVPKPIRQVLRKVVRPRLSLPAFAFDRYKRQRLAIYNPDLSSLHTPATPGLVSIVLPVYNGADMLHESIESILAQTYPNFELIAIDDGSTDETADILEDYARKDARIRVVHQENRKIPRTLSRGFRLARGEYLTWTSNDNHLKPDFLQKMVDFLERQPTCDMVYANQDIISEDGLPLRDSDWYKGYQQPAGSEHIYLPADPSELNIHPNNYVGAAFLYRSRVPWLLGDYSPARFTMEDYDYWMRVNEMLTLRHSDFQAPVYEYRFHSRSLTARDKELGITSRRTHMMVFDDFRRDFCLSPLIWIVETRGTRPELQQAASKLRQQIAGSGHLVYEVGQCDFSYWPRLWIPVAYLRLTDDPAALESPSQNIPPQAVKILALVTDQEPPNEVSTEWDMCLALGNAVTTLPRLSRDYQGWLATPDTGVLFSVVDIRVRSQHLALIEHEATSAPVTPARYKISVIICVYQRIEDMLQALTSVAHQSFNPADYEVVVVNNDPDDVHFAERLDEVRQLHFATNPERLRLVVCPLVGLSHARNAAISEARGEVLCFLDDDALASPTWLEQIWEPFRDHPEAGVVGGTILLKVPEPRPAALLPGAETYWSHFVTSHDSYTPVRHWWEYPWGANWCARRQVLFEIGGFRTRYGRQGKNFAGGEETLAAALIHQLGYTVGIAPTAQVYHNPNPDRFTWEHVRKSLVAGDITSYSLQRDLYVRMQSSILRTLRLIVFTPINPAIKGSAAAMLRYRWYRKTSYIQLLRQQLRDWRARGQKSISYQELRRNAL